jgi:hypothetical protein
MALWIKPDGTKTEVKPENGSDFNLQEMYRYTNGGPIEIVRACDGQSLIVLNEEGKLKDLPYNNIATMLYGNPYDAIVGDVLLCDTEEVK